MQNLNKPKLYILNKGFQGASYQLLPKYILKQLRNLERNFTSECRKLEWDLTYNKFKWIITIWDNGHNNSKFLINHILPSIENDGFKEESSRKPKIIIYINK